MKRILLSSTISSLILLITATSSYPKSQYLLVIVGMGTSELALINTKTDQVIKVSLNKLDGWPGGSLQHTWVTPDEKTVYGSIDGSVYDSGAIIILDVEPINWSTGTVGIKVAKVLTLAPPGTLSSYPRVCQVDSSQPIPDWTQPKFIQSHGPSFHPSFDYTFITHWTDNRIRGVNVKTGQFISNDPILFAEDSRQTHGINFNSTGQYALGTGYYYDNNKVDVYKFNKDDGFLHYDGAIVLGSDKHYAAFTHYTSWINNEKAYTATMQLGPTSLTPKGATVIGPSVWLLDVDNRIAKMVIGTAKDANDGGVYRSASDLAVVGSKLYIAEEDTIDDNYGDDGYISVFDVIDIDNPVFLKRFKPGDELPPDYSVTHGLTVTPDGSYVYAAAYASKYIIKIDTKRDKVVKVFKENDHGFMMPHGGFISGSTR